MKNHTIAAAALLFAACSSNTTNSEQDYEQVAQVVGANASMTAEPAAVSIVLDLASGLVPAGLTLDGLGRFSGDHGGLTFNGTITCTDAGTDTQAPCGPATANATVTGSWTGQLALPRLSITIARTGTWTLSGLQTATVTIAGTSHVDLTSQFASASDKNMKNLTLAIDATYEAVTVDRASGVPNGGDIQYAITGKRTHTTPGVDTTQTLSFDATLTFHADATATLVIDGNNHFSIDLATGDATPERD